MLSFPYCLFERNVILFAPFFEGEQSNCTVLIHSQIQLYDDKKKTRNTPWKSDSCVVVCNQSSTIKSVHRGIFSCVYVCVRVK